MKIGDLHSIKSMIEYLHNKILLRSKYYGY
jgi:hypothetical protein